MDGAFTKFSEFSSFLCNTCGLFPRPDAGIDDMAEHAPAPCGRESDTILTMDGAFRVVLLLTVGTFHELNYSLTAAFTFYRRADARESETTAGQGMTNGPRYGRVAPVRLVSFEGGFRVDALSLCRMITICLK